MESSTEEQNIDEINNLVLILEAAKDTRKELIDHSNKHTTHIWNSLTFLLLVLGAYITICLKLIDKNQNIYCAPFIISISLIIISIFIAYFCVSPKKTLFIPEPDNLYELTVDEYKTSLINLIQTYSIHNKKYLSMLQKNSFTKSRIHFITIGSILEYILFIVAIITDLNDKIINPISYALLISVIIAFIWLMYSENRDANKLKTELNLS